MPMIALSPVWWSWQKTTCSCSARPASCVSRAAPFSYGGIANTLVTVATLLIPFRFLVEPGSEPSVLRAQGWVPAAEKEPAACPGVRREAAQCGPDSYSANPARCDEKYY